MLCALLSDSHGALDRLEKVLENLENGGVTEVIHAGDFALGRVAEVLRRFGNLNFHIARGNCDVDEEILAEIKQLPNIELGEILQFELDRRKFALAHKVEDLNEIQNAEIFVSGHTHIPQAKKVGGKLFLNPGSLQDDGGYFLLNLDNLEVERRLFSEKM